MIFQFLPENPVKLYCAEQLHKAFTTITGYSVDEAIGNNPRMLQSGKQSTSFYKMMWRSIHKTGHWQGEVWNKRKNGELYPERLHIKSIYDGAGNVKFYIGNISDITEAKNQETLLRQSQKMEAVGTMVGGVAHNFNNMLAGIIGKSYMAKRRSNEPETIQYITEIESISNDAAQLVRQLLTFSHADIQQKKNISIVPLLKDAAKTAQLGISEDIEFITHFTNEGPTVYCDPVEIQQVLINLVNNARDALSTTQRRRIMVTVDLKSWENCSRSNKCSICSQNVVHLVIEDTGLGIAETDLEHIFDPFFTTKEIGKGTGLGLSMTKGSVEAHGGSIYVTSTVGVGTTFEICLPITNAHVDEQDKKIAVIPSSRKETILIVDDEDMVRTTLSQILCSLDYNVLTAKNGRAGIETFEKNADQTDMIIIDEVMPIMGGSEAVGKMRQIKPELPVVFITGYDKEELSDSVQDAKTSIVPKPFNVSTLSQEVHRLLHPDVSVNT